MLKKKKYIFIAILLVVGLILGLGKLFNKVDVAERKYLAIQDELIYNNNHYVELVENLSALELGKQIGKTDLGDQVFEIKGQNTDDWICVRNDGNEKIFRNKDIQFLTIDRFKTNKIVVKDDTISGGEQKTIIQQDSIDKILSDLKKENLSNQPETIDFIKKVKLYSEAFPGLCFSLYYLHNAETGTCLLYDYSTEETWVIGPEFLTHMK